MKFSFIYPGQGSQSVGMGKFLHDEFKIARETFEEASDAIQVDLKKLCFTGNASGNTTADETELNLTQNTQPALLTTSMATARVLQSQFGIHADITAGHSIGEYASLVLAQVISFPDAVKSVRFRGQAMQSAVPVGQGGMTATLGLDEKQVQFLCQYAEKESGFGPVSPANYNCDGQIVISGNMKALNWLKDHFKSEIFAQNGLLEPRRAKLIPLTVSAPFHCPMMKPAEEKMRLFLQAVPFANAQIPIIQNVHAQVETIAEQIKENMIRQVSAPVLWTQIGLELKNRGHKMLIECGNGSVLKGLMKKIDPEFFQVYSTNSLEDLKALEAAV